MSTGDGTSTLSLERLSAASVAELQEWRRRIDAELLARGHVRTSSSLAGELMERVVANAYGGELTKQGTKSADVVLPDGRLAQVKLRRLPAGDLRHWAFSDLDFDLAIVVNVDRETDEITWAREISRNELVSIVTPHASDVWRLPMSRGRSAGDDVTDLLRDAHAAL